MQYCACTCHRPNVCVQCLVMWDCFYSHPNHIRTNFRLFEGLLLYGLFSLKLYDVFISNPGELIKIS
jgi:hypothetical protein